jgi:SAM-dependent methyltransferase
VTDAKLTAPAAERNKEPILEVLRRVLPAKGLVLEIASGTGQHVVHFARALPNLTWQPSDPDAGARASISAWIAESHLPNVHQPLELDVCREAWPVAACNAIVCINMIHISPWAATEALLDGARRLLLPGGVVYLYGPYRRHGQHTAPSNAAFDHTAPSNAAFDATLRSQDARWGVRDLEQVAEAATARGFDVMETVAMPANNLSVVLSRQAAAADPAG